MLELDRVRVAYGEATAIWDVSLRIGQGELVAIKYKFTPKGQIQIESKDDLRKRLGRSPDRADALVLAAWDVPGSDVPTEAWSSPIVDSRWGNEGRGF